MSESSHPETESGMPPPKRFYGVGYVAVFVGIAVMISLVWTQMQQAQRRGGPALPTLRVMPDFALTSAGGAEVSSAALRDRVWVGYFYEPGATVQREMMENRLRDLQARLEQVGDDWVRIVGFAWTRPGSEVSSSAALPTGADPQRWILLTAPAEEIRELPPGVFGAEEWAEESTGGVPLRFWVVDGAGNIRSLRDATNPEATANLLVDIGALVREAAQTRALPTETLP
jgi:hypothetical protein